MIRSVFLLFALIFLGVMAGGCGNADTPLPAGNPAPLEPTGMLVVSYGDAAADTFPAIGGDSVAVLEWLRAGVDSQGIPLEVDEFSFGRMVTRIGSMGKGEGGYWLYTVNGGPVPEAASSYRVSPADTVLFFYR